MWLAVQDFSSTSKSVSTGGGGINRVYVHRSKTAVGTETYLNECMRKRLIPSLNRYHDCVSMLFWRDLASAPYAYIVQAVLTDHGTNYVNKAKTRSTYLGRDQLKMSMCLGKHKMYKSNWEAHNILRLVGQAKYYKRERTGSKRCNKCLFVG